MLLAACRRRCRALLAALPVPVQGVQGVGRDQVYVQGVQGVSGQSVQTTTERSTDAAAMPANSVGANSDLVLIAAVAGKQISLRTLYVFFYTTGVATGYIGSLGGAVQATGWISQVVNAVGPMNCQGLLLPTDTALVIHNNSGVASGFFVGGFIYDLV